mmetsp:Transcript_75948/g.201772  ORF Transcript_75948/g.201772 Transcript_75948/m.201772 type:complete len:316 (-) Transcript_75948:876-1823(-)
MIADTIGLTALSSLKMAFFSVAVALSSFRRLFRLSERSPDIWLLMKPRLGLKIRQSLHSSSAEMRESRASSCVISARFSLRKPTTIASALGVIAVRMVVNVLLQFGRMPRRSAEILSGWTSPMVDAIVSTRRPRRFEMVVSLAVVTASVRAASVSGSTMLSRASVNSLSAPRLRSFNMVNPACIFDCASSIAVRESSSVIAEHVAEQSSVIMSLQIAPSVEIFWLATSSSTGSCWSNLSNRTSKRNNNFLAFCEASKTVDRSTRSSTSPRLIAAAKNSIRPSNRSRESRCFSAFTFIELIAACIMCDRSSALADR